MVIEKRGEIVLFNPYHDLLGRFAARGQAVAITGSAREGFQTEEGDFLVGRGMRTIVGAKKLRRAASEYERISKTLKGEYSDIGADHAVVSASANARRLLAFYNTDTGAIVLSSKIAGKLGSGNSGARMAVMHEIMHSRGSSYGRTDFIKHRATLDTVRREEGLNSLLADRLYRKTYSGRPPRIQEGYRQYIDTVSGYFYDQARGDAKAAWKLIDDAHAQGFAYPVSFQSMKRWGGLAGSSAYRELMKGI